MKLAGAAVAAVLVCAAAAPRPVVAGIVIVNVDGVDEGFNDPTPAAAVGGNTATTLGGQRLAVFEHAAALIEQVVSSPIDIRVEAAFDPLFCGPFSATIGSAGATGFARNFTGALHSNTWYPLALANKLAGSDLAPNDNDISTTFNSAIGTTCSFPNEFYYGLDGDPPGADIDLVSVVLHEIAHGLGFAALVALDTGEKALDGDDAYMRLLEDHQTGLLYPQMTDEERVAASTNSGNLHWTGPAVVAAAGGLAAGKHEATGHVFMYAPDPQEPGSSVSHFDTDVAPNELMEPFYVGPNHDLGLLAQLFADIGWAELDATTSTTAPTLPSTSSSTTTTTTTTTLTTTTVAPPTTTSTTAPPTTTTSLPTTTTDEAPSTTLTPTTTVESTTSTTEPGVTTTAAPTTTTTPPSTSPAATTTTLPASTLPPPTTTTTTGGPGTTLAPTTTELGATTTTLASTSTVRETTTTNPGATTTLIAPPECGDPTGNFAITASDALAVLQAAVGTAQCDACVCDVNDTGGVTASDALAVLRKAVGDSAPLDCPAC